MKTKKEKSSQSGASDLKEGQQEQADLVEEGRGDAAPKDERAEAAHEPAKGAPPELEPISAELVAQLKQELGATRRQAEENLEGWQRARADYANYKKRVERDQENLYQQVVARVIRKYLEISDDLERALANRPTEGEGAAWAQGIELIYRKLQSFLEAEGIRPMEAEGSAFDPNLHEALSQEESDEHESGQVIQVVQSGYMLGDRVIRPALVRVSK